PVKRAHVRSAGLHWFDWSCLVLTAHTATRTAYIPSIARAPSHGSERQQRGLRLLCGIPAARAASSTPTTRRQTRNGRSHIVLAVLSPVVSWSRPGPDPSTISLRLVGATGSARG